MHSSVAPYVETTNALGVRFHGELQTLKTLRPRAELKGRRTLHRYDVLLARAQRLFDRVSLCGKAVVSINSFLRGGFNLSIEKVALGNARQGLSVLAAEVALAFTNSAVEKMIVEVNDMNNLLCEVKNTHE